MYLELQGKSRTIDLLNLASNNLFAEGFGGLYCWVVVFLLAAHTGHCYNFGN